MSEKFDEKSTRIEAVEKINASKTTSVTAPESPLSVDEPLRAKFDAAVQKADQGFDRQAQTKAIAAVENEPSTKPSPIEHLGMTERKIARLKPASVEEVLKLAEDTRKGIEKPANAINSAIDFEKSSQRPITITPAQEALLTDKLIHIDSNLKTTLAKFGVEVQASDFQTMSQKPLVKFLNYLTNSDVQLTTMIKEINGINNTGERLSPEKLLSIQIKLGFVQQEIEFFTNVLNKALESTKTIMNVQV